MKRALPLLVFLSLVVPVSSEASVTISMVDSLFEPATTTVSVRDAQSARTLRWRNDGKTQHTSTRHGVFSWDSGVVPATGDDDWCCKQFKFAGAFPYVCSIHPYNMTGAVKMKPWAGRDGSATIELGQTARVRVGTEAPPGTQVLDIQRRTRNGEWTIWKRGVTTATVSYTPTTTTDRFFRARLRRLSDGETSGWSPSTLLIVE